MVIKILREIYQKSVFVNQVYPVIAYKTNKYNIMEYRIFDETRSFTWISNDVSIIGKTNSDYYERIVNNEKMYLYKDIDNTFFKRFYLEDDDYEKIVNQLKKYMIEIIASDLSSDEIVDNIVNANKESEQIIIYIKAFFYRATEEDICKFIHMENGKINYYSEEEIENIINNIYYIKNEEVKAFFENLAFNSNYSKKIMDVIYSYLCNV